MNTSNVIYNKLEDFIRKYYTNELMRGVILFTGFGLMYFLLTLFVEYFLWLEPVGRTMLFWLFIAVELFLLSRFIAFPIFKLFKLQKGIDYKQASKIIGSHFSEVGDKLTNFLQLSEDSNQSELLLASIDQKAGSLQPVPFRNAVNYNSNRKFIPFALIPLLLFAFFYLSGNSAVISQSLTRVVNYKQQFVPPAPFEFIVLNPQLQTEQNKDFLLRIKTQGDVVPESAMIKIGNESYFMESTKAGEFQFRIPSPVSNVAFHVEANDVTSIKYELAVVAVPTIANFEMQLNFPSYLQRKSEILKGTGNAVVPEGTRITWRMNTVATNEVVWSDADAEKFFSKDQDRFSLERSIVNNTDYQIRTSNTHVKNYEKLDYHIAVVKDQFPTIKVSNAPDSLVAGKNYVLGQVGDDYGLSKLQVVYYPKNQPSAVKRGNIAVKRDNFDQFVFAFPSALPVDPGVSYEYYFQVFDNDAFHGFKSTKSEVFSDRIQTDQEKQDQELKQQSDNIHSLEKSLDNQEKQMSELEKLQKSGKESDNLEFREQQKVNDFIKRQKQQDEMMKEFAKKLEENLDKIGTEEKDPLKEKLQERLEKSEKDLEKNQKLLDELKELNDKLNKEELFEKLDKFKQNSKNQAKNLEQLVELTKRYYVEKKAEQLADKLDKLAEKQEKLANEQQQDAQKKQEDINKEFDKIQEELSELDKQNKELKSPLDIPKDSEKEKNIDEDLKNAADELKKDNAGKAKPKQKSAAKQMKEMSKSMESAMAGGEMETLEEDVKMLRQILDNLLAFSYSQEDLMNKFRDLKRGSPSFNKNLKLQQDLRLQFKHVDDSLFAMSLRNPMIAEEVTKEIGNVHYNIEKSLESLAEAYIPKGVSHQQYAVTAANKLADFLSDILNSMQLSLSGAGMGKPKPGQSPGDMQLPDIIQKQQGLGEKMKDGMKSGDKPGQKPGEKPGQKPGQGEKGKSGEGGNSGSGNQGESDSDGEGDARAIMEIYKEQKQLREALQNELNKHGLGGAGQNALSQMKMIEKQLLNKGFNNESLQKALNLKYELLKLEKAIQQQGEEERRQAENTKKEFSNRANALPPALQEYLNSVEILNRQSLPLRSNYNRKVQEYFKQ
ncbi:MAG: hypothetical protein ITG00_08365 [Flavobacterium sp.]|nr:hypothetical protein [Flavobacterium sp.]